MPIRVSYSMIYTAGINTVEYEVFWMYATIRVSKHSQWKTTQQNRNAHVDEGSHWLDTIWQFIVQVVQLNDFCNEKGICYFLQHGIECLRSLVFWEYEFKLGFFKLVFGKNYDFSFWKPDFPNCFRRSLFYYRYDEFEIRIIKIRGFANTLIRK